jgi:hypothetical protein
MMLDSPQIKFLIDIGSLSAGIGQSELQGGSDCVRRSGGRYRPGV